MLETMSLMSVIFIGIVCCVMIYAVMKRPNLAVSFYRKMRRVCFRIVSADSRIDKAIRSMKEMYEFSIGRICGLYKRT